MTGWIIWHCTATLWLSTRTTTRWWSTCAWATSSLATGQGLAEYDFYLESFYSVVGFVRGSSHGRTAAAPQINFPKMRQAGIDAGFFAIDVTLPATTTWPTPWTASASCSTTWRPTRADVVLVRQAADITRAKAEGKLAVLLAIEHADCTERSLNVLRALYELGVRTIGLTHNVSSWAADGCLEARDGVGLTRFGVRLVQEMNRLGMLVDLAHVSPGGFFQRPGGEQQAGDLLPRQRPRALRPPAQPDRRPAARAGPATAA